MDIQLYYTESGMGFPLILLHGNGEDGSYFSRQIPEFARRWRVIAPDTRGHGRSPRGTAPFTIAQFARDLADFLDELNIEKAHLLGFSDGANIALAFALAHPGRVEKLILCGGNLDPRGVRRSVQLPIEAGYKLASLFVHTSARARGQAELLGLMVNEPHVAASELAALKIRTLVIAGTRDMIRREHTELIARSLPNARLMLIPGDHFIAAKNADAFNCAVKDFLDG